MQVRRRLIEILDLELSPEDIADELPLYSATIGLDSLSLLELITRLESDLSCEINDEALMKVDLVDVGSLVQLVTTQAA
ncbi:acyl carrier protein [Streptomyces sp. NBC_01387]|uniref:acyl carrier protein n=1 Tax=unclassified Streptomyces TaxID=2593676 RepID=UPI00202416DD|nr:MULTISPECIES: acyl carrier protein [unclassified Streptomyces]MCX4551215.1 acyl carrier protein [Streptomyces sp. NBC_01500]WSC22611.1 acyl carrier protein [Streptomyces sp. NBC_01766]WSV56454.1 acyl carrier protein [Streptomyces sp. NBC_01014]